MVPKSLDLTKDIHIMEISKDDIRILNDIIALFSPINIEKGICHNYNRYIFLLKRVLLPIIKAKTDRKLRVLDVGAGAGIYSMFLRKKGQDVTAVDTWNEYTNDNIMGCKEDIIKRLKNAGVIVKEQNIVEERLDFPDNTFDLVLFIDVIEHLLKPKKVLLEINRVLKKGGCLVLETPNTATLRNRIAFLTGKSISFNFDYWFNSDTFYGHIREYTIGELKKMLEITGFGVSNILSHDLCLLPSRLSIPHKSCRHTRSFFKGILNYIFYSIALASKTLRYTVVVASYKK